MNKTVTIDVREDIRKGLEPFSKIMGAAAALQTDEQLLVIAPFEPVPLFSVLAKQGFCHSSQAIAAGEWEVRFTRNSIVPAPGPTPIGAPQSGRLDAEVEPAEIVEVDARELEPPQPLVKILETLSTLRDGGRLEARTDRRPMHLYVQLEERGFSAETQEQPDGSFLTYVRRR